MNLNITISNHDTSFAYNVLFSSKHFLFIYFLKGLNHSRSPEQPAQVICDSWVGVPTTNSSASEDQRGVRGGLAADNGSGGPNMPVSYFEMYKNRMKKLKEAGLRADVQTVNLSDGGNMPERPQSLTLRDDALYSPHDDTSFEDYTGIYLCDLLLMF